MLSLRNLPTRRISRLILQECVNSSLRNWKIGLPYTTLKRTVGNLSNLNEETNKGSRRIKVNVNKFGRLSVRDVTPCNFNITAVSPGVHPDQNVAFLEMPESINLKVNVAENNNLTVRNQGLNSSSAESVLPTCNINVPIKYNVEVDVEERSDVRIDALQNEYVMVTGASGNCILSNIHSNGISVSVSGGSIMTEGLVHGNAIFKTQLSGNIKLNKVLSQLLDVKTESGDIDVKSLYSVQSKFVTNTGSVHIGNAHRDIEVEITSQGQLIIDSLDGNLNASVNRGDVEVYVSRTEGVNIKVEKGDIALNLSTSLDAHLDLRGNSVAIDDEIQLSNVTETSGDGLLTISGDLVQSGNAKPSTTIRAHSKEGSVILQLQDWIESLKLGTDRTRLNQTDETT